MIILDDKINFRVTKKQKEFFQMAAKVCGYQSVSQLIKIALYEKLRRDRPDFKIVSFED